MVLRGARMRIPAGPGRVLESLPSGVDLTPVYNTLAERGAADV